MFLLEGKLFVRMTPTAESLNLFLQDLANSETTLKKYFFPPKMCMYSTMYSCARISNNFRIELFSALSKWCYMCQETIVITCLYCSLFFRQFYTMDQNSFFFPKKSYSEIFFFLFVYFTFKDMESFFKDINLFTGRPLLMFSASTFWILKFNYLSTSSSSS